MTSLLVALVGALGVHLLYTALALGWRGAGIGPPPLPQAERRRSLRRRLARAGVLDVPTGQIPAVGVLAVAGAALGYVAFGGAVPSLVLGGLVATAPPASARARRRRRRDEARDAWPRMIDEIRVLTGSAGRSVPQALFEAGRRAPAEMQAAFDAAHREWALTTDFDRTIEVLKARLADPTADAACETLLVAHQLGGTDLDRRLTALAEDRRTDAQERRDAVARQAGARFARWFTIVVPLGMALVGMSIGEGREAYRTTYGQVLVVVALALVVACWIWATRIMRLPDEQRVLPERGAP